MINIATQPLNGRAGTERAPLGNSSLFTKWIDPQSGIESLILTERVAPLQQSFYFVNVSMSGDGRYFWFYCAFPPGGSSNSGRTLAVIDFAEDRVTHFPDAQFSDASPLVDPATGEIYWCHGVDIWKRSPQPGGRPQWVNSLPADLVRNRRPWRLATHLSFSADRRALGIDVEIGREWFVGHAPLDGSDVEIWQRFDRCYNHAQCNPVEPDLMLIAQDHFTDVVTGALHRYENRLWLLRRGETATPVYPHAAPDGYHATSISVHTVGDAPAPVFDRRAMHGHEWWDPAGTHVWYVHYGHGVERVPVAGGTPEVIWPTAVSHAHADSSGWKLVADALPPSDPAAHHIKFFNRKTEREVRIVSQLPAIAEGRQFHVHPHPQFCCDDEYICYTTNVLGRADVAFVAVADLMHATR